MDNIVRVLYYPWWLLVGVVNEHTLRSGNNIPTSLNTDRAEIDLYAAVRVLVNWEATAHSQI